MSDILDTSTKSGKHCNSVSANPVKVQATTQAIQDILEKAQTLRGFKLSELTRYLKITYPDSMLHAKGLVGQIIELLLGATAKSKPLPDFPELGLEIKTLPIDLKGNPLETTYVSTAPLVPKLDLKINTQSKDYYNFFESTVYKKLRHVLWLPIIVLDKNTPDRIIGNAFLWQPSATELKAIETDWLELTEMLYTGNMENVSSYFGEVLQIRPKANDASALTIGLSAQGEQTATLPRGFYLRTSFTKSVYSSNKNTFYILP